METYHKFQITNQKNGESHILEVGGVNKAHALKKAQKHRFARWGWELEYLGVSA